MNKVNPTERFSSRVEAYARFRPGYPEDAVNFVLSLTQHPAETKIADVGSGTGIFTRLLLEKGAAVFAVEPNAPMRERAEQSLCSFQGFSSLPGTAEKTGLPDQSVDLVVAAQAFHWFNPPAAKSEFRRILKPGGRVALIWNERMESEPGFDQDYENFLVNWSNDYLKVKHQNAESPEKLSDFFQGEWKQQFFYSFQPLTMEGLKGRYDSCSYALDEKDSRYEKALSELKKIFERYQGAGRVVMRYRVAIFYGFV